jgi:hypothetical protein
VSITFKLEIEGRSEEVNFSNGNAAALLMLAGLPSAPHGEIPRERLEAVITKLLRALNSEPARAQAVTSVIEGPRWSEGARTDEYLKRRVGEMMAMLVFARTHGCAITWG